MSKLIVNSYKHTGKWYHEEISEVRITSWEELFELERKIKQNHPDVHKFSGLVSGFGNTFNYVVKLEGTDFFMDFLLVRKEDEE